VILAFFGVGVAILTLWGIFSRAAGDGIVGQERLASATLCSEEPQFDLIGIAKWEGNYI
jgi:hypothetical protein